MAQEVVAAFQWVGDACLSPVQPEGTARGQTVGARGRFGRGRGHAARTGGVAGVRPGHRQGAGRREVEEAVSGSFVIFSKFKKSSYVNSNFLLHLGLK